MDEKRSRRYRRVMQLDAGMLLAKLGLEPTNAFVFIKDRSPTAGHPK
jgi:hypothetical protein